MRLVLQRALNAAVTEVTPTGEEQRLGAVESGFVILVGFGSEDGPDLPESRAWQALVDKVLGLRVFPDADGKMNLSLEEYADTAGILLISQFTLYADCRRGRRPSFTPAAPPAVAEALYERLLDAFRARLGERLQCGRFGADMRVSFTNWGPVTILLDSKELSA